MSWQMIKLKECCISITDGDHQPPPKVNEGVPFVTISNFGIPVFIKNDDPIVFQRHIAILKDDSKGIGISKEV